MEVPSVMAAHVDDRKTFSNLIQFGRGTNQKRRVGMLLTLGANVGLETAEEVPFIIGAKLDNGEEQFRCPIVGKLKVGVLFSRQYCPLICLSST